MTVKPIPLEIWDRHKGQMVGEFSTDHPDTYESEPQRSIHQWLESQPLYDWLIAVRENSSYSVREIAPFIREHNIDMRDFKPEIYRSFAEFFDREFKTGARPFTQKPEEMAAFAEARYFGWEKLETDQVFPVKGRSLKAEHILGNAGRAQQFASGPVLLARLSPIDYHHVHYMDAGETLETYKLGGRLWTVNWHALQNKEDILFSNERQVNILKTENFGTLAFVEIGALSVGRIVQVHPLDRRYERGAEKSVFRFGGSAVVVFGEAGAWRPSPDILEKTGENIETLVRLGQPVAFKTA